MAEQYYPVSAVAAKFALSTKTIRRLLADDPDVISVTERRRGTRKYETLRIPDSSIARLVAALRQG